MQFHVRHMRHLHASYDVLSRRLFMILGDFVLPAALPCSISAHEVCVCLADVTTKASNDQSDGWLE